MYTIQTFGGQYVFLITLFSDFAQNFVTVLFFFIDIFDVLVH